MRPLVFVDVDGVLNRVVSNKQARARRLLKRKAFSGHGEYRLWLDLADKRRLDTIAEVADLAWGTTWEHYANLSVAPFLGLVGDWPVAERKPGELTKAYGVQRVAAGRPLAWLDDALDVTDRATFNGYPAATLLVDVDPEIGLSDANVDTVVQWADGLSLDTPQR